MRRFRYSCLMLAATIIISSATACTARMGMMHGGYGMQQGPDYPNSGMYQQMPLDMDRAEAMLKEYVQSTGNPNLKVGEIKQEENAFVGTVVTKEGSLVDTIWIDKYTGAFNTRYGMGANTMHPEGESGRSWNFCPYCGSGLNSSRYHGTMPMMGHGYGMGYGMHGYGMGYGMHGYGMGYRGTAPYTLWDSPKNIGDAEKIVKRYLVTVNNPNLKLGKIQETEAGFKAEIVTKKKEDIVNQIIIDKETGRMRSVY